MRMPAFGKSLSDAEIAALANYAVDRFGGQQAAVTSDDVRKARLGADALDLKPYINAAIVAAIIAFLVFGSFLVIWVGRSRGRVPGQETQ